MSFITEVGIKMQDVPSECPIGYKPSIDGTYCIKEDVFEASPPAASPLVEHYTNYRYSLWGLMFYKLDQNGDPLYNLDGTWDYSNPSYRPDLYRTVLGGNPTTAIGTINPSCLNILDSNYANTCWVNTDETDPPVAPYEGRLNQCGVWDAADPNTGGILGFNRLFDVDVEDVYYVGFSADNLGGIYIDGIQIMYQDIDAMCGPNYFSFDLTSSLLPYRIWWMVPVKLKRGSHTIKIIGDNVASSLGILGCEIYKATQAQLVACTSNSQLEQYVIFSTIPTSSYTTGVGTDNGEEFDRASTCPVGYEMYNDNGTYYCRKVDITDFIY